MTASPRPDGFICSDILCMIKSTGRLSAVRLRVRLYLKITLPISALQPVLSLLPRQLGSADSSFQEAWLQRPENSNQNSLYRIIHSESGLQPFKV